MRKKKIKSEDDETIKEKLSSQNSNKETGGENADFENPSEDEDSEDPVPDDESKNESSEEGTGKQESLDDKSDEGITDDEGIDVSTIKRTLSNSFNDQILDFESIQISKGTYVRNLKQFEKGTIIHWKDGFVEYIGSEFTLSFPTPQNFKAMFEGRLDLEDLDLSNIENPLELHRIMENSPRVIYLLKSRDKVSEDLGINPQDAL